ncbi:hypothetical protein ACA910_014342 [Epithemia clementina (nom. ined.)]
MAGGDPSGPFHPPSVVARPLQQEQLQPPEPESNSRGWVSTTTTSTTTTKAQPPLQSRRLGLLRHRRYSLASSHPSASLRPQHQRLALVITAVVVTVWIFTLIVLHANLELISSSQQRQQRTSVWPFFDAEWEHYKQRRKQRRQEVEEKEEERRQHRRPEPKTRRGKSASSTDDDRLTKQLQKLAYLLRPAFEQHYDPKDWSRIQRNVQALRVPLPLEDEAEGDLHEKPHDEDNKEYSTRRLHHCPVLPSRDYPRTWSLVDILTHWNPNQMDLPPVQNTTTTTMGGHNDHDHQSGAEDHHVLYHSLCVLDWNVHSMEQIQAYRQAEVPFVLQNHPEVMRAAERWNVRVRSNANDQDHDPNNNDSTKPAWEFDDANLDKKTLTTRNDNPHDEKDDSAVPYLVELLRHEVPQRNEYARQSNHLPFWRGSHVPNPPTQNVELSIVDWWHKAQELERAVANNQTAVTAADHYYFRFSALLGNKLHAYLYHELPVFVPYPPNAENDKDALATAALFMVDPEHERGINCRFGMMGSMADNHFDASRNWILVLRGQRRYILAPPEQCPNMQLHGMDHMSARHSMGNWADPSEYPALSRAQALQVVLQPGDALYLPTSWFHFIVSLTTSFQCNARSGTTHTKGSPLDQIFTECGFSVAVNE